MASDKSPATHLPTSRDLVRLVGVSKSFSGVHALSDVTFGIQHGTVRALVGENGSGKSTLIKLISGALAPDRGLIQIEGKEFPRLHPIEAIQQGIQVIYQDFSLFPNLSIAENIAISSELARGEKLVNRSRILEVARAAIAALSVELDLLQTVEECSVAEKQIAAICRALVQNARLIIMDEPTTALTQQEVRSLFNVIGQLRTSGIATLFVSHRLDEVREVADSVSVLRNGRVTSEGPVDDFSPSRLSMLVTGRPLERLQSAVFTSPGGQVPSLRVERLGHFPYFDHVSFEVHAGETVGLTGLLGAGQRELLLCLFGLLPARSGRILLDGVELRLRDPYDAVRAGVGFVPEDRLTEGLFLGCSVEANIAAGQIEKFGRPLGWVDRDALRLEVDRWKEAVEVPESPPGAPVRSLSGGNQQRVVLARWLSMNPRLLLLHNPTAGVDVGSKYNLHTILRDLADQGVSILLVSDDIPELLETCDRILVMRDGRILTAMPGAGTEVHELSRIVAGETRSPEVRPEARENEPS